MTQPAQPAGREVEIRACCGNLRWALLDAVESLPAGCTSARCAGGRREIPLDVEAGARPAADAVQAILDAAGQRLGPGMSCYAGRGALVIDAGRPVTAPSRPGAR